MIMLVIYNISVVHSNNKNTSCFLYNIFLLLYLSLNIMESSFFTYSSIILLFESALHLLQFNRRSCTICFTLVLTAITEEIEKSFACGNIRRIVTIDFGI